MPEIFPVVDEAFCRRQVFKTEAKNFPLGVNIRAKRTGLSFILA
jgi:hypothetical protein